MNKRIYFRKDFLYDIERKDEAVNLCWHSIAKFIKIDEYNDLNFIDIEVIVGGIDDDDEWTLTADYTASSEHGYIITEIGHYLDHPEYLL